MSERQPGTAIEIRLNGDAREVAAGTTVADLVDPAWGRGVAVARNGEVVPRARWDATPVQQHDEIEIVHPIQGGGR